MRHVQGEYKQNAAEASLAYHIKDAVVAMSMGINTDHLYDNSATDLWMNKEYMTKEWRVFRDTGVSSRKVLRTFRSISNTLFVSERIMLEIQYAWLDAYLPDS